MKPVNTFTLILFNNSTISLLNIKQQLQKLKYAISIFFILILNTNLIAQSKTNIETKLLNNTCETAQLVELTSNGYCSSNEINVYNINNTSLVNEGDCLYFEYSEDDYNAFPIEIAADSFFKFVVPGNGQIIIDDKPIYSGHFGVSIYETCNSEPLRCFSQFYNFFTGDGWEDANSLYRDILITNLPPNDTLIIQFYQRNPSNFDLCMQQAPYSSNNNCSNPEFIEVKPNGNYFWVNNFTNTLNLSSSCDAISSRDSFFEFVIPESGAVYIDRNIYNTLENYFFAEYGAGISIFDKCTTEELFCVPYGNTNAYDIFGNVNNGFSANITIRDFDAGDTLLMQVRSKYSSRNFNLQIRDIEPTIENDCSNATKLNFSTTSWSYNEVNLLENTLNLVPTCLENPSKYLADAFYTFTVPEDGIISVHPEKSFGFAIYPSCNEEAIFCTKNTVFESISNLPAGEELILQIFNEIDEDYRNIEFYFDTSADCNYDEWLALKKLYKSTDGDNWFHNAYWGPIKKDNFPPYCNLARLRGIAPLQNGKITLLDLSDNNLTGIIPPGIENLSGLTSLNLANNNLTGAIPSEIGSLSSLTLLNLIDNELTGEIPPELALLYNLDLMYLSRNDLNGCFQPVLSSLCNKSVYASGNNFDATWEEFCDSNKGVCNIGDTNTECNSGDAVALKAIYNSTGGDNWVNNNGWSILNNRNFRANCNLTNLHGVTLNEKGRVSALLLPNNNLTGSIPPEIGNLTELDVLGLASNQLSGPLPVELGNLFNLTALGLSNNQLSGNIPSQLGNLVKLKRMFLTTNQLSGNIPTTLGSLNNLEWLILAENNLSGSIPAEISNLNKLIKLMVQDNQLTGCFDDALLSICDQLTFENPKLYINKANDFEGLWTNFCECSMGSCTTNYNIEINTNTMLQNEYETEGNINTIGNVSISAGQDVRYKSTVTTLNIGFEAKQGCELLIVPKICN